GQDPGGHRGGRGAGEGREVEGRAHGRGAGLLRGRGQEHARQALLGSRREPARLRPPGFRRHHDAHAVQGRRAHAHRVRRPPRQSTKTKELYIVDYDGYNPRRVTVNGSLNILPNWSPDGRSLAYVSY